MNAPLSPLWKELGDDGYDERTREPEPEPWQEPEYAEDNFER
jgi:hypothetical protein